MKNSTKTQTITTIMRITEIVIEAADPIMANRGSKEPTEAFHNGEGDSKTITGDNIKAVADILIIPMEVTPLAIIMVSTEAEVDVAMAATIIKAVVMDKAIIKVIIIITSITHKMMVHK